MRFKTLLIAILPALAVFLGVWRIDYQQRVEAQEVARTQFEANAVRTHQILENRASQVLDFLRDTANVVAQTHVTAGSSAATFDRLVGGGDAFSRYPELEGIAFARFAYVSEVDEVAQSINADPDRPANGHGDFVPRPPTDLDVRVMIELIHPLEKYSAQAGFDLLSTPRRDTLLESLASRAPTVTNRIKIFGGEPGVVVYQPTYLSPNDLEPHGWSAAGFATAVFLENLRNVIEPLGVDLALYDMGPDRVEALGTSDATRLGRLLISEDESLGMVSADPRAVSAVLQIANRQWRLWVRPAVAPPVAAWVPNTNVGLGAIVALLIGGVLFLLQRDANYLSDQVARRTSELEKAVGEIEERRARAQHQAVHDELTGLANRRGFERALAGVVNNTPVTVLSFDLDGFKAINDSRGHAMGDEVLKTVAAKLVEIWGKDAVVARLSGDEYVVAVPTGSVNTHEVIDAFLNWTSKPIQIRGQEIRLGASIGTSDSTVSGNNISALLADADLALYRAKSAGKNRQVICTPSLRSEHDATHALGEDLLNALDRDEIEPYFQTQHSATDHRIVGAEALVRWIHPERGIVPPGKFLPVAENLGIMHALDGRVLDKSLAYVNELKSVGLHLPKLSVNVSAARLSDPKLLAHVESLPETSTRLVFEIIEAVFLDDRSSLDAWSLDLIRERGIGIELDDFGTGHASVVALTNLRPDRMKLDQKFVLPLPDPTHEAVLRSIVGMGQAMGIPSTAEGIETPDQAKIVADCGVDVLQGFLFGKPISVDQLKDELTRQAA